MQKIESKSNEKIKQLKKLHLKKYRDKFSLFFVENFKIIRDGLDSGFYFKELFVSEEFALRYEDKLKSLTAKCNGQCFEITKAINKEVSLLDNPSGVFAVYEKVERRIDLTKNIIYLNGLSDPGNVGTIIRTALAFGFENIVVDGKCADVYNPKTIQASKDAIFKVNIEHDVNCEILKTINNKMKVYAADMEGDTTLEDIKKNGRSCLVFGSEAHGISAEVRDLSDGLVKVEMSEKIESLNVAISAGILLYGLRKEK